MVGGDGLGGVGGLGGVQHAPNRITGAAITDIGWIDSASIQVEVVHTVIIEASRGPEAAVRPLIVRRATAEVAREGQTKSGAVFGVSIVTSIIIWCLVFTTRASGRHSPTFRADVFGGITRACTL